MNSLQNSHSISPWFLLAGCLFLLVTSYVVGAVIHAQRAGASTLLLVAQAEHFPRRYSLGTGAPLRYLMLGDSTAMGVGCERFEQTVAYQNAASLAKDRTVSVTNLGISGARLRDVIDAQIPGVSGHYDVITVLVGANDATHLTSNQSFWSDLQQLISTLTPISDRLILVTPPNFTGTPALPGSIRLLVTSHSYAERQAVLQATGSLGVVDLFKDGHLRMDQFAADGFHPNASGYALWATLFAKQL